MSAQDWSSRCTRLERMDDANAPEDLLFRTLQQFATINRLFTRAPAALETFVLRTMQRNPMRSYRLVDLGAGGCDLARWLIRRCRHRGLQLTVRALESDPRIRRYAATANTGFPEIELVAADALDAQSWDAPDFAFANHLLHHLPDERIVELLRRLDASGARFVLCDIVRSRWAVAAYRLAIPLFFRKSFLLEDGLLSIRRAFIRRDLEEYIARAGLDGKVRLFRRFPFRWLLVGGGEPAKKERIWLFCSSTTGLFCSSATTSLSL